MAILNYAQQAFSSDVPGPMNLVPRQKFNFTLFLEIFDSQTLEFTRVSSVTVPGFQFDTVVLSQYNNKRVVQTKMNYDPITVTFYDTFDNEFHNLMKRYIKHYYNGGLGIDDTAGITADSTVNQVISTYEGYTPVTDRYFFTRIVLRQNGLAGSERSTILYNPTILSIQGDTLDYSASDPVIYTVQFQPERITTVDSGDAEEEVSILSFRTDAEADTVLLRSPG